MNKTEMNKNNVIPRPARLCGEGGGTLCLFAARQAESRRRGPRHARFSRAGVVISARVPGSPSWPVLHPWGGSRPEGPCVLQDLDSFGQKHKVPRSYSDAEESASS